MKDKLLDLQKNSYSPYSNFAVSAVAIMKDGKEFNGVNVENAAYGAAICAERSAILSAISNGYKKECLYVETLINFVSNGYKKGDFKEINIMTSSTGIGTPCFQCRQVISELFAKDSIVRCYSKNGAYKEFTVEELCPYPFGEDDLK